MQKNNSWPGFLYTIVWLRLKITDITQHSPLHSKSKTTKEKKYTNFSSLTLSTAMASTPVSTTKISLPLSRKLSVVAQLKPTSGSPKRTLSAKLLSFTVPSLAVIAASAPLPALAEKIEKAALFDFNLTLPVIAIEFLLLMVALDKLYFTPLGNFMDDRDAKIRAELNEVKDASSEVKTMQAEADAVMRAARAEVAAALNKMKDETTAELEVMLNEGQAVMEAELQVSLENLEKQKEEAIKVLNAQIDTLSEEIISKVLAGA